MLLLLSSPGSFASSGSSPLLPSSATVAVLTTSSWAAATGSAMVTANATAPPLPATTSPTRRTYACPSVVVHRGSLAAASNVVPAGSVSNRSTATASWSPALA